MTLYTSQLFRTQQGCLTRKFLDMFSVFLSNLEISLLKQSSSKTFLLSYSVWVSFSNGKNWRLLYTGLWLYHCSVLRQWRMSVMKERNHSSMEHTAHTWKNSPPRTEGVLVLYLGTLCETLRYHGGDYKRRLMWFYYGRFGETAATVFRVKAQLQYVDTKCRTISIDSKCNRLCERMEQVLTPHDHDDNDDAESNNYLLTYSLHRAESFLRG